MCAVSGSCVRRVCTVSGAVRECVPVSGAVCMLVSCEGVCAVNDPVAVVLVSCPKGVCAVSGAVINSYV